MACARDSPSWWIFTGERRAQAEAELQAASAGAILIAVFWCHNLEPGADHIGIGDLAAEAGVPMESREDQQIIRKQVIWHYAEGWSSDTFGKLMGSLLE